MNNFNYCSPTEFVFGKGRAAEAGYFVKKYGGSKALIHYGGGSAVRSGLIDTVKKIARRRRCAVLRARRGKAKSPRYPRL